MTEYEPFDLRFKFGEIELNYSPSRTHVTRTCSPLAILCWDLTSQNSP